MTGLWLAYIALVVISPFIGGFIVIMPDNQYFRAPQYPLILLPMVAVLLLNLAGALQRRKKLSRKVYISFLVAILPMTIALIAQLFFDVFPLLDISFVLSAMSMYGLVLSDQIEQDRRHQQEIANQRARILVLQMRPHFIYNTLIR